MRSFYRLALLALPFVCRVSCADRASHTQDPKPLYANPNEAFQDLLNALPEESLHVALNSLTKFKDGVFESDRHGVERVHHENPPLATKLIVAAVQDLKKRQTPSNGTQSATSSQTLPPQSSEEPSSSEAPPPSPASSQPPAVVVPVPVTTTAENGETTVVSSSILSEPTASATIVTTRTNEQGSTEVATETKPAVVFSTTDSAGSAIVTTSPVNFVPTAGEVLTTTDSQGSTFLTTYTPSGGKVSSVKLITTTGSDGKPSVVTSYTYIDPAAATQPDGGSSPSETKTGKPGLQSGAAQRNRAMEAAILGGAVGGAFAIFA